MDILKEISKLFKFIVHNGIIDIQVYKIIISKLFKFIVHVATLHKMDC